VTVTASECANISASSGLPSAAPVAPTSSLQSLGFIGPGINAAATSSSSAPTGSSNSGTGTGATANSTQNPLLTGGATGIYAGVASKHILALLLWVAGLAVLS